MINSMRGFRLLCCTRFFYESIVFHFLHVFLTFLFSVERKIRKIIRISRSSENLFVKNDLSPSALLTNFSFVSDGLWNCFASININKILKYSWITRSVNDGIELHRTGTLPLIFDDWFWKRGNKSDFLVFMMNYSSSKSSSSNNHQQSTERNLKIPTWRRLKKNSRWNLFL